MLAKAVSNDAMAALPPRLPVIEGGVPLVNAADGADQVPAPVAASVQAQTL